ncbi:alpha-ketoacid dehydrogenase subunit alpha/beta [Psychroflexus sp. MBR-150]|jgi:2-oxoisovalerate dehydrogenase E1 component
MNFNSTEIDQKDYVNLFKSILKPRLIEEKMLILLRQGKISKWFSGIGQEAIAVGVTLALKDDEYILPMHRNLGVFTTRNIPLHRLFSQWQGKLSGFTKGRDRSFHFGTQDYKIIGMISHLGPQLGVADGIALAQKLRKTNKATCVFTGEGGTSEGDFHEALNIASVWQLPVVFCVENNGYGLSTPTNEQFNIENIADRGKAYGIESHIIDGNNIAEVYEKMTYIFEEVRKRPKPVLVEFKTFRRRGHEEASGTKYVPNQLISHWSSKDPIDNLKKYLLDKHILDESEIERIKSEIKSEIDKHLQIAFNEPKVESSIKGELNDVYAPNDQKIIKPKRNKTSEKRFVDAISDGLRESMQRHDELVIMGQDIAEYGGVFKITEGFVEEFGKHRVRNTPICESGVIEAAMGLSICGIKSVVEMQFGDFVSSGFNPIVNYLAKTYYRWQQNADVVIRMPCGAGVGAGPFHSQTNEAWFTKTPGLKVVYPAFPEDAKGLLCAAIDDPNPVLFFEHKALYRSLKTQTPDGYFTHEIGKAQTVNFGNKISIITYGMGVHWALALLKEYPENTIDIIDLKTLKPLDTEAILSSVKKTSRVVVLQEDSAFGGLAAEIAAWISEHAFQFLDAPVKRVCSIDTPIPFAENLEKNYLANSRLKTTLDELLKF